MFQDLSLQSFVNAFSLEMCANMAVSTVFKGADR